MNFYAWMENDLRRLKKINVILSLVVFSVVSLLIFTTWSVWEEEYCREKAQNIVGDKWNTLLDPIPGEYGYVKPGRDKITLGFREQLKCERGNPI